MTGTFRFYKDQKNAWYVDLPDWNGSKAELEMVQGADTMLDKVSGNTVEVTLKMSDQTFDGAELLILQCARTTDAGGGGDYLLERYQAEEINYKLWLCEVVEWVFKDLPETIYFTTVIKSERSC